MGRKQVLLSIGLWGHKSGDWFNKAKSEVVIDSCTFDTLSLGIYYNEEAPLLNLKSTVTNNIFKTCPGPVWQAFPQMPRSHTTDLSRPATARSSICSTRIRRRPTPIFMTT